MLKERKSHLYRLGGAEDHVHILTSLHPTVALADLVKEIKTASSAWIKGHGAFTVEARARPGLIDYIRH